MFGIGIFGNDSARKFIQARHLDLALYRVEYFRLGPDEVKPATSGAEGAKYQLRLGPDAAVVEYRFVVYDVTHGVYDFRIDWFVRHFRLTFATTLSWSLSMYQTEGSPRSSLRRW